MTASKSRRPKQAKNLNKNRPFRARGALDEKLEAAAKLSGRSVNEEIEYRLERSFRDEEIREQAFEQAWASFQKKKALENVETALDNVEAALASSKAVGSAATRRLTHPSGSAQRFAKTSSNMRRRRGRSYEGTDERAPRTSVP